MSVRLACAARRIVRSPPSSRMSRSCASTAASRISMNWAMRWRQGSSIHTQGGPSPKLAEALVEAAGILVQLVAPMMPHLAEECWAVLGREGLCSSAAWPLLEPALLVDANMVLPVQVNGRKRADLTVRRDADDATIEAAVLQLDAVRQALDHRQPKKIIIVPRRIVNVVG